MPLAARVAMTVPAHRPVEIQGWREPALRSAGDTDRVLQKTWPLLSALLIDLRPNGAVDLPSKASFCRLVAILQETGGRLTAGFDEETARPRRGRRPIMFYVPAGFALHLAAPILREARILTLQFNHDELVASASGDLGFQLPDRPREIVDPRLLALLHMFEAECLRRDAPDPLLGNCLATGLLSILADHASPPNESNGIKRLGDRQLRLVTDYIDTHLSEPIAANDLARLVGLSPGHFCRAFKASTGLPPHTWFTARRIARAKMLMRGQLSLVHVALATGFSDQSHFTRSFNRLDGLSPGAWRRLLKNCGQEIMALAG